MDISVTDDPARLSLDDEDWMSLWDADPSATPFHTPDYALAAWQTELEVDRSFRQIRFTEGDSLVGLINLTIEPNEVIHFLGNASVTDYLGPLSLPDHREQIARGFVEALDAVGGWRGLELLGIAADSGWIDPLHSAISSAGLTVAGARLDVCPRINIDGGIDAYFERLPSKLRHEFKRKERRLVREAGDYTVRLSDRESLLRDLETFYAMHRASDGPKGHFMYEEMAALFTRMATAFLARGWLRLSWLEIGGEPWAAVMSFACKGAWNVYNSAYDHTKRDLAPGMVLMGESIRLAAAEGATVFDLLRGDEPYKYRFGAQDVEVRQLTAWREHANATPALDPSEQVGAKGA